MKARKIVFSLIMVILVIASCYVILEYVFARFYYSNVYLISDTEFDPVLGWRLKPGTYWAKAPNTFTKHRIDVNSFGLRDEEFPGTAGRKCVRIIILGDSFAYGKASRSERIFPARLEQLLNSAPPHGAYDVINAGVPGFGTAQELLLTKDLAENGITADIYLVIFFTNDILDNLGLMYSNLSENRFQPKFVLDDNGTLRPPTRPETQSRDWAEDPTAAKPSLNRTRAIEVLRLRIESYLQAKPRLIRMLDRLGFTVKFPAMPGILNGWYREEITGSGIPLTRALLASIRDEAAARGGRLLVAMIPSQLQVYPDTYTPLLRQTFPGNELITRWIRDPEKPQRVVSGICDGLGIPFLDLQPILLENNSTNLYIPREGHLNDRGHALVAQALVKFIGEYDR